jgi:pullulanase
MGLIVLAVVAFGLSAPAVAAKSDWRAACDAPEAQQVLVPQAAEDKREARAVWMNAQLIKWPGANPAGSFKLHYTTRAPMTVREGARVEGSEASITLKPHASALDARLAARFNYLGDGLVLDVMPRDRAKVRVALMGHAVLVKEDDVGRVQQSTHLQIAGALDDLYRAAKSVALGARVTPKATEFALWAPTARTVDLCIYDSGSGRASLGFSMSRIGATGVWQRRLQPGMRGKYFSYVVEVYVPNVGWVRNRVTDPYSVSLTTDSLRSYVVDLSDPRTQPAGWSNTPRPAKVVAATDMSIYELHVRDFSINDPTVSAKNRGKYLAFTESSSNGMKHLAALSKAGLTDVHLLPVFDIATIPESGCVTPQPSGAADSNAQQKTINEVAGKDCFNWGYDPFHFNAPEGSYASDAADGLKRIVEFRQMVMALNRAGLRVGMDVVYNHTSASGQNVKSVLDRIVPGYYHRLNAVGKVEQSTCCENTATEHMMMAKLMIDSAVLWATQYRIDSFRFDLMAHQPRSVMEELQVAVNRATRRHVELLGEGWNFGEVENGKRFVQASQLSLNGSGIGTFTDRMRDAVRGGAYNDEREGIIKSQGYINGLVYAPNALADKARPREDLLKAADMVRVGMAGSIRDYSLTNYRDEKKKLEAIDYNGQPAGYVVSPSEIVNYVENHDNQTLFDINVYKLPLDTSPEDRARVQMLGAAIVAFSQGIAYFHAGIDTLRSKSLDGNSFDSGDWFNRIDWSYRDNYFGTGLPPERDNRGNYAIMKPLLANAALKPTQKEIVLARDMFRDLLSIRAGSTLFRLRTAADIKQRLMFYNVGAQQIPTLIAAHLNGVGYAGANFKELIYFVNVAPSPAELTIAEMRDKSFSLHPVHVAAGAGDKRVASDAKFDAASGKFSIPARAAVVFVLR